MARVMYNARYTAKCIDDAGPYASLTCRKGYFFMNGRIILPRGYSQPTELVFSCCELPESSVEIMEMIEKHLYHWLGLPTVVYKTS